MLVATGQKEEKEISRTVVVFNTNRLDIQINALGIQYDLNAILRFITASGHFRLYPSTNWMT